MTRFEPSKGPKGTDALGLLGLARRAGMASRGVDATRRLLLADEAGVVLVAEDASETQLKKVEGLIRRRGVPVRRVGSRSALGRALGAAAISVAGVGEGTLARQLLELLPDTAGPTSRAGPPGEMEEDVGTDAGG